MSGLPEFLLARYADDEAVVRAVHGDTLSDDGAISTGDDPWPSERAFAERFTTGRVLAEVEAKRRIVGRCAKDVSSERHAIERRAWETLRDLAMPFADHPDYREEWAL